jgi:tRNA G10  N-methylase Trm11
MQLNKIYFSDALEFVGKLEDGSIDAIVCDPPYFTGMTHNKKELGNLSDLAICRPFYRQLFAEFKRVLKLGGGNILVLRLAKPRFLFGDAGRVYSGAQYIGMG